MLEINKKYHTRYGGTVTITHDDSPYNSYRWVGSNGQYYDSEGNPRLGRDNLIVHDEYDESDGEAMTLRDRFAIAALQGLLARDTEQHMIEFAAQIAYQYADAMMKARGK